MGRNRARPLQSSASSTLRMHKVALLSGSLSAGFFGVTTLTVKAAKRRRPAHEELRHTELEPREFGPRKLRPSESSDVKTMSHHSPTRPQACVTRYPPLASEQRYCGVSCQQRGPPPAPLTSAQPNAFAEWSALPTPVVLRCQRLIQPD